MTARIAVALAVLGVCGFWCGWAAVRRLFGCEPERWGK